MEDVLNASLAGGVMIGTASDMCAYPVAAMIIGFLAGVVSTLGFRFLSPMLEKIGLHDTCGVLNLHGIPGIIAGLIGSIWSGAATVDTYGTDLSAVWPERPE